MTQVSTLYMTLVNIQDNFPATYYVEIRDGVIAIKTGTYHGVLKN